MDLAARIAAAKGEGPVDLLLTNGRLVNVLSGEIYTVPVAIHEDLVVGFGDYEAKEVIDLGGRFIAPGFIDGHLHLESSMLAIPEFARNVVPLGTTTVVADPHEIANVMGVDGIQYILSSSEGLPLQVYIMFPSCVPATPFETSGAELVHQDMEPFKNHERVLGLAEVMNFPGVVMEDPEVLAKMSVFQNRVIDGHAPGLSGQWLCAYIAAGIGSDHECTTLDEAKEKLNMGMHLMIREGSAAKNLDALFPVVNEYTSTHCSFVTDDMDPRDITEYGHINRIVRKAIAKGLDPVRAIQMASINTANYFRLHGLGAVAPGYKADFLILDDLENFGIHRVYKSGRLVAEDGRLITAVPAGSGKGVLSSVNVDWDKVKNLSVAADGEFINIIQAMPGEIVTKRVYEKAPVVDGQLTADTERDILKMAVIERHKGTGSYSVGFIRGFGLRQGAIGCTVAHDAHNIIVVGTNDADMMAAAKHLAELEGGMTVVINDKVVADLPLPIAGLMSDRPIDEVVEGLTKVVDSAHEMGCQLEGPFATLSFMALTPIPELKLTDQGLFDSVNFKFVSLFEDY